MNICQRHWDELRAAIEAEGLSHLVARDGKEAVEALVRDLREESTVIDFDPLMGSAMNLASTALHYRGLWMLLADETGRPPCPVCAMETFPWVTWMAAGARTEAERRGLVEPKEAP